MDEDKSTRIEATMKFKWHRATGEEIYRFPTNHFKGDAYVLKQEILLGYYGDTVWCPVGVEEG